MYSAVLMLALTAGSETADFGRRGCSSMCSGCVASSCGGRTHGHGGLFHRRCSGACSGYVGCTGYTGCSSRCHGGLFSRLHNRGCCCGPVMTTCSAATTCASGCSATVAPATKTMPKSESVPMPKKTKTSLEVPSADVASVPATIEYAAPRRVLFPGLFRRN